MQIVQSSLTVADYCHAMDRGEVIVNTEYQRSDQVWPANARSLLIETILLGYPIPKFYLYQVTDLRSRRTVKEIVDGQQRSMAIRDFFGGGYRLSQVIELEEARGKTYDELGDQLQGQFLNYGLQHDLMVGATPEQVRETFRRMNLFTVPLNAEEQRHAVYQGKFKWFIHRVAREYDEGLREIGVFSQKQLVRMADTKLFAEIAHALLYGITTTDKTKLDSLYRAHEVEFEDERLLRRHLTSGFDLLLRWTGIHHTALMKPYQIYSLVLAAIHVRTPVLRLQSAFRSPALRRISDATAVANLSALAEALDNPDDAGRFAAFVAASAERTNVVDQRRTRFQWFCRAICQREI